MNIHDNAYSAFLVDYAAGALPPAERLAGDLHMALSSDGRVNAGLLEAVGGVLLEQAGTAPVRAALAVSEAGPAERDFNPGRGTAQVSARLAPYLERNLLDLPWRRSLFGVKTLPTGLPLASLLRLDPGERAPQHGHGRRDVTVVLEGTFADEFGVYERGDLAFAEPGLKHEPRAVGDRPCVCLIATEPGRPLMGFLGLFGLGGAKRETA